MIGTSLGTYRITAALGAGGMGEVWRAIDTKLGREVALKLLPAEMAADPERLDRFEREARAVAALNHPHIVTIYSVEDADGIRFLTMELIEGRSLDTLIPEGGLNLERFFDIATPLADAISAAHDKSVIHRDLKPSNVMVDCDGRVKVLDFGLAKLQQPGAVSDSTGLPTEALTGVGMIVGTVPYMSPEQIEGKIVDHRTDVFSLGVLLYEMATGERPFHGESSPGLMSSILKDTPTPVLEIRTDLPRHLGRVIGRCLAKDRRDRYQTARDVYNELKALRRESTSTVAGVPPVATAASRPVPRASSSVAETMRTDVPWIAVLPFSCRGGDAELEAFANGLEEDIATGLSRFSYLFVVARKSTRRFRGEEVDVRHVGEQLGARYVMEGGLRKAGSAVRINVQLVDAETGTHLWAESYDRDLDRGGTFAIQDGITDRVVATVADPNGVLVRSMAVPTGAMSPHAMTAHQAVLRYFLFEHRISMEDHRIAREALERAVESEPGYADAWACLAMIVLDEDRHDFNRRPGGLDRSMAAARRAVEVDPSSSLGHYALATVHFYRRDLGAFRATADKAINLNRRDGNTMAMLGILYGYAGDWERGIELTSAAMQLNPHHPGWYRFTAFFDHYRKGEFEAALAVAQKINMPAYFADPLVVAIAHKRLGNHVAAETAAREMLRAYPAEDMRDYGRFLEMWLYAQPALLAEILDDLRSIGVEIAGPTNQQPEVVHPVGSGRTISKEQTAAGPGADTTVTIAVLPFTDMSPGKDQDYFCEGMAEEIMNALVQVDGIRVVSRTSAFRAVEEGKDLRSIGRALSVGQILEGSVRIASGRLRVTAQLIEVESGYQLWSERFDREAEDVFAIQDEIAAGVVEAVESRLASGVHPLRTRAKVSNVEAYRHYLKARHYRYSKNDHAKALEQYERALAVDPTHGPSWVGKAEVTVLAAVYSLIPSLEAYRKAKEALETARELQGESAEGSYVEGMIALCEARWQDSEEALLRAVELEPTLVQGLAWTGFLYSVQRRYDEAEEFFKRACELDPLAPYPYAMMACGLLANGRPEEASEAAEQAIQFDRENTLALWCTGMAQIAIGRFDNGVAALEKAAAHARRGGYILGVLGWGLAAAGLSDIARAVLDELQARDDLAPTVVSEAWIRAALGDCEGAWRVLERAIEEKQAILTFAGFPPFDPLRSDARFAALLDRLRLPPSNRPSGEPAAPASDGVTGEPGGPSFRPSVVRGEPAVPDGDAGPTTSRGSDAAVAAHRANGNLPAPVDSFVAREEELADVSAALRSTRSVTLVGVGGTGKTRLATEIARRMAGEFADGTWLVELAPVTKAEAVPHVVADLVGAVQQPGKTITESVVDSLRHRALLLVLDNCEHVLDAAAELAAAITTRCSGVRILATSRENLAIRGEQVIRLLSLADEQGAVLFRDRARAAGARGELEMDTLARLSRRLDGMPLAIELAAARSQSMSPEEIETRLDDRFRLLRGSVRGRMERHQTLRSTVAWSYEMLEPVERQVFDRLSAFAGGFTREAAVAVAGGDAVDGFEVEDAIESLVARSMVLASNTEDGTRYRLLETLRQFGEEQLVASGDAARIHDRHMRFFTDFMVRAWYGLWSDDDPPWIRAIGSEFENLRVAVDAAIEREDGVALTALLKPHLWWAWHALRYEVADWAEAALEVSPEPACVRAVASHLMMHGGRPDDAVRLVEESDGRVDQGDADAECLWALARFNTAILTQSPELMDRMRQWIEAGQRTGNVAHTAAIKSIEVVFRVMAGEMDEARRIGVEAYEEARATGNQAALCWATFMLGRAYSDSEPWLALEHFERAAEIAHRVGLHLNGGFAATEAAVVIARFEEPSQGRARLARALRSFINSGDHRQLWTSAHHLAYFLVREGRAEEARSVWRELGNRQAWAAQHHRDELEALLGPHGESKLNDDELVDRIRGIIDALDGEAE